MASCSCNDKQKKVKKSQYSLSLWSVLWLEFERSGCQKQLGFMNFSVCILHLDEIYKKKKQTKWNLWNRGAKTLQSKQ